MSGHKGFARCDEQGFMHKIHTTPAHVGESPQFESMIDGSNAQRVLADKANASTANRDTLKGKHRDGILHKAVRARPLRQSEKRFKKLISKHRFRIEQCFDTMKRLFGLYRAQYFGVAKIHAQMIMAALSQTLLKAAHKNIYQQINPGNHRAQTENTNPPVEIAADWKAHLPKS